MFFKAYFYSHGFFSLFVEFTLETPKFLSFGLYILKWFMIYFMVSRFDGDYPLEKLEPQEYVMIVTGTLWMGNILKYAVSLMLTLLGGYKKQYYADPILSKNEITLRRKNFLMISICKWFIIFLAILFTLFLAVWHAVISYPSSLYQRFRAFWIIVP